MSRVLLLTGVPGSGKTIVMLRTVEALKCKGFRVGGMISREARVGGSRVGFEILSLIDNKRGWLAHVDQKAGPQIGKYRVNLEDLEGIGVSAINEAIETCDVVAVDEIGPMETCSNRFRQAVLRAVSSMKLVVATIHWRERNNLSRYNMSNARLFEVTIDNRKDLHELITKEAIERLLSESGKTNSPHSEQDKEEEYARMIDFKDCTKCSLSNTRRNIVFGEGNEHAEVMFIGEAPGYYEDVEGRPFVGAAGKFLNELLSEAGLERTDVYITNILKCRPPNNREPLPDEIEKCTPCLEEQIKSIKPKIIITLGNYATEFVFSKVGLHFGGITRHHGKPHEVSLLGLDIKVYPTFHPASALYHGEYKTLLLDDFRRLKNSLSEKE